MITSISIRNYKVHKDTHIRLANLTVLAGQNSSGKSSIIQSLLLLRQSYLKDNLQYGLQLQGECCNVGLVDDAICQYADDDTIYFSVETMSSCWEWIFSRQDNSSMKDMIPIVSAHKQVNGDEEPVFFTNDFQYISAARWEPRESYPLNTSAVELRHQLSSEYGLCDLVAHYIYYYGNELHVLINPALKFEGVESLYLLDQVSAWERAISAGVNVSVQKEGKAFSLKYSYTPDGDFIPSREFSATNVGYGLSYALPIIVAMLTAKQGSMILVENPEIHLHPQGQAALAKLIARTAQSGVQVVVETHSDHIINGILVASKQFENEGVGVDKGNVEIYQCVKSPKTQLAELSAVRIVGDGKIDSQPLGFFDQTEKDLQYLMGF